MFFGNPAYKKVKDALITDLKLQYNNTSPIHGPLSCSVRIFLKKETWIKEWAKGSVPPKYSGTDIDNKISTVFDLLKDAGVVHDDCQFVRGDVEKFFGREDLQEHYGTQIKITRVSYDLD